MPDFLDIVNKAQTQKASSQAPPENPSLAEERTDERYLDPRYRNQGQQQAGQAMPMPDDLGTPQENEVNRNTKVASEQLGGVSVASTGELEKGNNAWSAEFTMRDFWEESAKSIARGVGKHIVKGTGDLIQVASAIVPGQSIATGNPFSRYLQETGAEIESKYKAYIPEELMSENLTFGSMMDPKFWSIHAAEMIPQLAEFIFLSKGGGALAKRTASGIAKGIVEKGLQEGAEGVAKTVAKNATRNALGKEVFGSGQGIIGKLVSDQGLTKAAGMGVEAIGGGFTGNILSGVLNAAEVVNSNKDLKDAQGNLIFNEDDLSQMAASTIRNNAAWMAVDMASFGLTFGGGWKALKGLNPITKGMNMAKNGSSATIAKMFSYDVAPIIKGIAKVAGKAGFEGLEETFQESFEEWSKKKAIAEVTGEGDDKLFNPGGFWEFYKSKENRGTIVLSAAMGALGGSVFNIGDLIDKKADESHKLHNRIKNFEEITKKQGTEKELTFQEMHVRKQIADLVIDEKTGKDVYNNFMNKLIENENINEEEKKRFDQMYEEFDKVKQEGKLLNVKGLQALLQNKAEEGYAQSQIETYQVQANKRIEKLNMMIDSLRPEGKVSREEAAKIKSEQNEILKKIQQEKDLFKKRAFGLGQMQQEAMQNQRNLILGKRANPIDVEVEYDQFGNEIVVTGLSRKDFKAFTKAGEKSSVLPEIKSAGSNFNKWLKNITSPFMKNAEEKIDNATKGYDEFKKAKAGIEEQRAAELEGVEDETDIKEINARFDEELKVAKKKFQSDQVDNVTGKKSKEAQQAAEAEAEQMAEEAVVTDENETVSDEDFKQFEETGEVSPETLNGIAEAIMNNGELTNRQEDIRVKNRDAVKNAIVNKMLGIDKVNPINTDDNIDPDNPENPDNNPDNPDDSIDNQDDDTSDDIDDEDVSDDEKEFIKSRKTKKYKKASSLGMDARNKADNAKSAWKIDRNKTKGSEENLGMDARDQTSTIFAKNYRSFIKKMKFLSKLSRSRISTQTNISQNELDNYLNSSTMYNEMGPSNLDKMVLVNHQLKRMFPENLKDPAQVIIVKNMYEAIGSVGVGHSLAATMFIDEKAWEQDWVFMHELSHIYYKLAKDAPETQEILKMALANKELVREIRSKYDDLTLYQLGNERYTKGQFFEMFKSDGVKDEDLESELAKYLSLEDDGISTVPLNEQHYLLEEMFTRALQNPLADNFDKIFSQKEAKRQKEVKKFWGMLRRKGEVIEDGENGVQQMIRKLADDQTNVPKGNPKNFILDTFKAVTEGIKMDGIGMDARVGKIKTQRAAKLDDIRQRMSKTIKKDPDKLWEEKFDQDYMDEYEDELEETGNPFSAKEFKQQAKGASKIIKRFGIIYNKSIRRKFLKDNVSRRDVDLNEEPLFERHLFESEMYNLAKESKSAVDFIYQVENSAIKEMIDFNDFLDKTKKDDKLQLLNGMYFVFSNAKHVNGIRNVIKKGSDGEIIHEMHDSLSIREKNITNNVIANLREKLDGKTEQWANFRQSVLNIQKGVETESDYFNVINNLTDGSFNEARFWKSGYITYDGLNIPIETLVSGYLKRDYVYNRFENGTYNKESLYVYGFRNLVEALQNTNRKYTEYSSVLNAEGNMEQSRIANNHMTNEIDNMVEYLHGQDGAGKPTLDQFMDRYSHTGSKFKKRKSTTAMGEASLSKIYKAVDPNGIKRVPSETTLQEQFPQIDKNDIKKMRTFLLKDKKGSRVSEAAFNKEFKDSIFENRDNKAYHNNEFLVNIYNNFQNGQIPQISQYHGLEDIDNKKSSLFKNSTALEQGVEDLLTFLNTSTGDNGKRLRQYLGNMGTFSDSPRKFFMNMNRIKYDQVFDENGHWQTDGKILNNAFNLASAMFPDNSVTNNKAAFKKSIIEAMQNEVKFIEDNLNELSNVKSLKPYIRDKGNGNYILNKEGKKMVGEYVMNNIVHGLNVADVFLPGVTGKGILKRMKANSSPILSIKNPEFKSEFLFFADEIVNGSIAGSDSGMYILKEQAEKLQKVGQGVFDMNNGFKLLNSHIEKNNPNFEGKLGYLKGYTTIVDENHWAYPMMKARMDKYNQWHEKQYGQLPSDNYNDGTPNHLIIAMPQSSDKSNFAKQKFYNDDTMEYTEEGQRMAPSSLKQDWSHVDKMQDDLYYDDKGNFVGLETYNFGPQQVMDKITKSSNTPVQMVNSIMVNAALNGEMDLAIEIQQHLSDQKMKALDVISKDLASGQIDKYKEIIDRELNKEDMDQAQRHILEDKLGSVAHPYVNEIAVNQLAKMILRAGNKLKTPGTNAHQKPDTGYNLNATVSSVPTLLGYEKNIDGSLSPAHMILPKHMAQEAEAREDVTRYTHKSELDRIRKSYKNDFTKEQELDALKSLTVRKAKRRAFQETGNQDNYEKFMGAVNNKSGVPIGFYVKGETVMASRVPGHGPSSTGVFEVIGFDESSDGNQVMVPGEFNEIIGSDNDGDSLFIQKRGDKKEYADWNKAFDKLTQYWLSPKMAEQIQTKMDIKKVAQPALEKVQSVFSQSAKDKAPFSPEQRRQDYSNTMVSKRNIGKIFNLHKIANLLAAYETPLKKGFVIGNNKYNTFRDTVSGDLSRNQQSAVLANIILDNAKHGYADAFGFDEHNMAQATLLINLGVSLEDTALILNSDAAKAWSEANRNNSSLFHSSKKTSALINDVYQKLGFKKRPKNVDLKINIENIKDKSQQPAILETLINLSQVNGDLQKISAIMSGHNKIHVNPFVLNQQIQDFSKTLKESEHLTFNSEFGKNPDIQQYLRTAEEALKHSEKLNPVYRPATKKVLEALTRKLGGELSTMEIENISKDLLKFNTSRLIGLNNISKAYVQDLLNEKSETSIFKKMTEFVNDLKMAQEENVDDPSKTVSRFHNSVLFRKALNMNLSGDNQYISASSSMVDESFTAEERTRIQEEFEELPTSLQDDLILYDMVQHGWKDKRSMAPFFGRETSDWISYASNEDAVNKNVAKVPKEITDKLETIIALKQSMSKNNSFPKVYLKSQTDFRATNDVIRQIIQNKAIQKAITENWQPMYINVRQQGKTALYELPQFDAREIMQLQAINDSGRRNVEVLKMAAEKIRHIPNTLSYNENTRNGKKSRIYNPEIDIAMIEDIANTYSPYKTTPDYSKKKNVEGLVEANLSYQDRANRLKDKMTKSSVVSGMDAREDFDIPLFRKEQALTQQEYERSMEFNSLVPNSTRTGMYEQYLKSKKEANRIAQELVPNIPNLSEEDLMELYQDHGNKDVYAYSIVITPIVQELASRLAISQSELWKDGTEGKGYDGKDVNRLQAYMMTGSTIPSNHPSAQAMARILEKEYKTFIGEKRKYMTEINKATDALYKDRLGYGTNRSLKNVIFRLKDFFGIGAQNVYDKLYGNLVVRQRVEDKKGNITYDFKLKSKEDIAAAFARGEISKAENDFYNVFKKTTSELMPAKVIEKRKEDYIPHTSMTRLEKFSARGLLGLMANSRSENEALSDVKMNFKDEYGEEKLMSFRQIEDSFKRYSGQDKYKNDIGKIVEYRNLKKKALKLLKEGKNEDGTPIKYDRVGIETALGFGAINRFTNNRSVTAEELPSMDLNKALSDYVHATLFVNGNSKFKGMEKLQSYIDGVLAFNRDNNFQYMNEHVQTVWKDYFTRGKRQTSLLGEKTDKVIRTLTNLNLFYALGYQANKNTGGLYVLGNIAVGKYHNIKDVGGKTWINGELKYWGLDKGFEGGIEGVLNRHKRMSRIMKNLNFMDINVYDEVNIEKQNGLDKVFSELALMPMTKSEEWIQRVHMIGLLNEDILNKFDDEGNYKKGESEVDNELLVQLEDKVKQSHGRGYQPTDQRAVQMYSWGNMMMQFSKFIPTMIQDRFAKKDVNIYGQETIGSLRAVGNMVREVVNDPSGFVEYRNKLSKEERAKLDSGLRGMAMSTVIGFAGAALSSNLATNLFGDANYYINHPKLSNKMIPPAIQSTNNFISELF